LAFGSDYGRVGRLQSLARWNDCLRRVFSIMSSFADIKVPVLVLGEAAARRT